MSLRKGNKAAKERGVPQRKSMAGPTLLGTFTAPGAIRKSIAYNAGMLRSAATTADAGQDEDATTAALPDYTSIEGRINVGSVINVGKEILCCKYNEEFDYVAVGCSDGSINMFQAETSEFILMLIDDEIRHATAPCTAIQHRPVSKNYPINNSFTCTYANGLVKSWNYNFRQCIYTINENRETFGITYHPRYTKFITYGDDSKVYLYDEESRTQERILCGSNNPKVHDGHTSRVFAACFNPRSNYELLSGGWDDVVHFWDLRQPHAIRHISGVHMCGEGIDISQRGTEVLTCSFQKEKPFQVWDYASGKLIGTMENDDDASKLYVGRYASKEYAICGGTSPNVLEVVDVASYMRMGAVLGLPSAVYSLDLGAPKKLKEGKSHLNDFAALPQVAFVSGRKLYKIDFY